MRYVLKQKLFSLTDDFYIKDEQGADVFFVDGKLAFLGEQLSLQDFSGQAAGIHKAEGTGMGTDL